MSKVAIIGGGAAGMFAAVFAARRGHEVSVYEKNEKLGKKLFITGKGRCNITNACEIDELFASVLTNAKFLYSSFYGYTNEDVIRFFEDLGVKTKVERGNRVFPVSDHSSDVIKALEKEMKRLGVVVHLHCSVKTIKVEDGKFAGLVLMDGKSVQADACIVATGGFSYQTTGSTGDGYEFAKEMGHTVETPVPALVPMEVKEEFVKELQGLSLRNVRAQIKDGKKVLCEDFGEMLFTHYGVSGPLMLSASSIIGKKLKEKELTLLIDLKPALSEEMLDARVLREFEENKNRQFKNAVTKLFPAKLTPVMVERSGILAGKKVNEISKEERKQFVYFIKHFSMTLTNLRGFNEAIITRGGVKVKEIDPGTMESKLVNGVYFAGEVLDLDALTGGFNLQIAWSTAYAAAMGIQ
ncbi:NAD(P)/FAD-dependent oxidoreductase [Lachnoclostridium sp. An181]|uniref:NAD(P)/FAD-dependent oxidoreductase n=1 Tax=Lachnoclostridium sp. An181 TaxID=1965575 RepID=UPI000B38725F|nr:NAD(P)/FAD-dependent oxidoreductase [Lachnoclostridium sp. An181]OUP50997.1 aminoacetone oxidase family FAD-binding enzyme [Lachnoclostridium sp. An181]